MLSPKTPLFSFITERLFHQGIVARGIRRTARAIAPRSRSVSRLHLGEAEHDQTATLAKQPVVLAETGRAQRVDEHVDALAAGDPPHLLLEVLRSVVDRMLDPLLADRLVLGGGGGAEDLGAAQLGDLGRRDADAAGGRVDQHPVALLDARP